MYKCKEKRTEYKNYRGWLKKYMRDRVRGVTEGLTSEGQGSFRSGKGYVD